MNVWAVVPARGGSKSIRYKNLVPVAGYPLLDFGVRAVQASGVCSRILCSTEDERIAAHALSLGIEVDRRPDELAGDDVEVARVIQDLLRRQGGSDGALLPDLMLLVQPTSPFLRPDHVVQVVEAFQNEPTANSVQNITLLAHNCHAFSQREVHDGHVQFVFAEQRAKAYNKQLKPKYYKLGNLIGTRPEVLLAGEGFFAAPSVPVEIDPPYDFDLDIQSDIALAEALIASGCVDLPHMNFENAQK